MSEKQSRALQSLTMPNEAFFAISEDNVLDVQQKFIAALDGDAPVKARPGPRPAPEEMLLIKTPEIVDAASHGNIPLLMGIVRTGMRQWEVDEVTNTASVLTNLEDGQVYIQWPLILDKRAAARPGSMQGARPDELEATSVSRGVRYFDLRTVYRDYNWKPSHYAITIIEHQRVTNTQEFELLTPEPKPAPEVPFERFGELFGRLATSTQTTAGRAAFPLSMPAKFPDHHAMPVQLDIDMAAADIGLRGQMMAESKEVLPLAILLFQKDDDYPQVYNFTVPVERTKQADGSDRCRVSQSLDLAKGLNERELTGEFLVFVNIGKNLFGPQKIRIGN